MNNNYIVFPDNEYNSYLERINNGKVIYTTRISKEVNKYKVNNIYDSVFGLLKVISVKHYSNIDEHPFLEELTKEQIEEINKYIIDNGFDLIELEKI